MSLENRHKSSSSGPINHRPIITSTANVKKELTDAIMFFFLSLIESWWRLIAGMVVVIVVVVVVVVAVVVVVVCR